MSRSSSLATVVLVLVALALAVAWWSRSDTRRASRGRSEPHRIDPSPLGSSSEAPASRGEGPERAEPPAETQKRAESDPDSDADVLTMHVVVCDAFDSSMVPGARVRFFETSAPPLRRTDENGRARVPVHSWGARARLLVEADGYCPWSREGTPESSVLVFLVRATRLTGRILAADTGEPVAGAQVMLVAIGDEPVEREPFVSQADGGYELDRVPALSRGTIEIRASGFATNRREFELLHADADSQQDIHLERGRWIRGRVEDWTSGRGIGGAAVGDLTANAEGAFEGLVCTPPLADRTTLEVRATGHAALEAEVRSLAEEIVFRLPRYATVQGRVSAPSGPVVEAVVGASLDEPDAHAPIPETSPLHDLPQGWRFSSNVELARSGADGSFRLELPPWSLDPRVFAGAPGFQDSWTTLRSTGGPGSASRLDLVLQPRAGSDTRLLLETRLNGQSLRRGIVRWTGPTRSGVVVLESRMGAVVEPGALRLQAELALRPDVPSPEYVVHLAPGEQRRVTLDVTVPMAGIRGHVLFDDGRPAEGVVVSAVSPADHLRSQATTDAEGAYELRVPDVAARFDLSAEDDHVSGVFPGSTGLDFHLRGGFAAWFRTIDAASGVVLRPGSQVRFLFTHEGESNGRPVRWSEPLPPREGRLDPDGWLEFRLPGEVVEALVLPVAAEVALDPPRRVALDSHRSGQRHELAFAAGLDVVLELEPEPLPDGVQLWLVEEDLWWVVGSPDPDWKPLAERSLVRFDAKGKATLRGVAPGRHRFRISSRELAVEPEVVLVEERMPPVPVRWRRRD